MDHPYTYVFIRTDLSLAQQMVQLSHAALEAGKTLHGSDDPISSIIMLPAKNKAELHEIAQRLERYDIKYTMFKEPDFDMGHSAIATMPIKDMKTRRIMTKYNLYKPTYESSSLP